jgi:predicted dehydrogenase
MHQVGIIGLGVMGQRMLEAMSSHPRFDITHVWDVDADLTTGTAARHPGAVAAADAESLIDGRDLDLVYLATPPAAHVEYARLVVSAGTAILCEKPLAVDLRETRAMVDEVEQSGVANAVQFPFATDPVVTTLEEDLRNGLHGEAERIEIRFHFNAWPRQWQSDAGSWLSGREQGGFLREVFSHFVYLTHRLVGLMKVESGDVRYPRGERSSEVFASAQFLAADVPTSLHGSVGGAAPDFNEWTLYGSKRSYRIQDWGHLTVADTSSWADLVTRGEPRPRLFHQLDELAAMIDGEPHSLPTMADGFEVQEVVEGLLEHAR